MPWPWQPKIVGDAFRSVALYSGRMLADCIWAADGGGVGAINGGGWPAKTRVLSVKTKGRVRTTSRGPGLVLAEFY